MPTPLLYVIYGLFFLILSERLSWESAVAAVLAVVLSRFFLTGALQTAPFRWRKLPNLILLWSVFSGILLREICVANLHVAMIVLSPRLPISPQVSRYTTRLKNPSLLTIFCTAITLTPGTMTVDIEAGTLRIHCLTQAYAESLDQNPVEPILLRIEEVLNG